MTESQGFRPHWCSPPGATIADALAEKGLSNADFFSRISEVTNQASELLAGAAEINEEIARRLNEIIGGSVKFWMTRERQYREDLERLNEERRTAEVDKWLRQLPLADMRKFGWLKVESTHSKIAEECFRFFDIPSLEAWHQKYDGVLQAAAYRTSGAFQSQIGAVAAWLRQGEIESDQVECERWDPNLFHKTLSEIRRLTWKKNPNLFLADLVKKCAGCGVVVSLVRAPTGCRASGATRFLSKHKAMILLSFRYLTDDHFWFTFFHEAGHLLLHSEKAMFLEGTGAISGEEEAEANHFAQNLLVPPEHQENLYDLKPNGRAVLEFAKHIGIAPGIVVGQLQHSGSINRNQLNYLKRRFRWI